MDPDGQINHISNTTTSSPIKKNKGRRKSPVRLLIYLGIPLVSTITVLYQQNLVNSSSFNLGTLSSSFLMEVDLQETIYPGSQALQPLVAEPRQTLEQTKAATKERMVNRRHTKIAWLMSFPNSGTTYTLNNTQHISNMTTATNYAQENLETAYYEPVRREMENGPWLRNESLAVPDTILVKTHCTGYGDMQPFDKVVHTYDSFELGCGRGMTPIRGPLMKHHNNKTFVDSYYKVDSVSSAVHLVRDPFNNIVSRMHHGIYRRKTFMGWTDEQANRFNTTREGMLEWCRYTDGHFWKRRRNQKPLLNFTWDKKLFDPVPCHSEYFKYVQWHNYAGQIIANRNLSAHTLYYEDYETNYNQTTAKLFNFLDLPIVQEPLEFKKGKTYRNFFTASELKAARKLVNTLATAETWYLLSRYFYVRPTH
jgi:hypothetical protein